MTTRYQNRTNPIKRSTSTNANNFNPKLNNNQPTMTTKPTSILKKATRDKPYVDRFNESVVGWNPPVDLDPFSLKSTYSPIGTPPRLRTMITPPGIEPYRNPYNLRRLNSPLPSLDDWHVPPAGLDTWGLDPIDYRLNQGISLYRRYPSPLTHFGLGRITQKQKKSYFVVPRLTSFSSPPISRDGIGNTFILPSQLSPMNYVPDPQYTYLEKVRSMPSPKFQREPADYVYIRRNDAFLNRFIDDFISKTIEDQFIPDILLEIISELDRENKNPGEKSYKPDVDQYFAELNSRLHKSDVENTRLFSDEWIRELDYKRPPIPSSNINSNINLLKPLDFRELPPDRSTQSRYNELTLGEQGRSLRDINQELNDIQRRNMEIKTTSETLSTKFNNIQTENDIYRDIETEVVKDLMRDTAFDVHRAQGNQINQDQFNSINKFAENKLLDTICLDQLVRKYIKNNGSVVDVDDLSRLLDATTLDSLLFHHQDIDESRSRTLDNYALRKFHLNSFMNITMDLLLTELSASLIEDMKDLDEEERKVF